MKKWILPALTLVLMGALSTAQSARADEDVLAAEEIAAQPTKDRPEWNNTLKTEYKLTDAQIKTMQDKGLTNPQMAMAAALSEKSGKTLDEVLKMRTEDKMGWGKIAKELGVPPQEIGQSVARARHEMRAEKHGDKSAEKAAESEDNKNAKADHRAEKREDRLAKKEAKREEKTHGKH